VINGLEVQIIVGIVVHGIRHEGFQEKDGGGRKIQTDSNQAYGNDILTGKFILHNVPPRDDCC
jgi:hypothetical protein